MIPPMPMRFIYARDTGAVDSFGGPVAPAVVAADVPCFWWPPVSGAQSGQGAAPSVVASESEHLICAFDVDIKPGDTVTQVHDQRGIALFDAPRVVSHVHKFPMGPFRDCELDYAEVTGGRS